MSDFNDTRTQGMNEATEGLPGEELIEGGLAQETEGDKFLSFRLDDTVYAAEIIRIKEIIEYGGITRIPMTPSSIRGVLNLRGNVVPVIDLAERLGCSGGQVSRRTCVIITEMEDEDGVMDIGFVVDAVDQVVGIHEDCIEPAPSFGTSIKSEYISGMGKVNDKFVILLNMDAVFSVAELAALVAEEID